ncbi:MAG: ATP synthase subunit b [Candidatus Peregrinibacteria bacterium GW2011_GWA2_47_7]|nr:MAG: ATP synthase subunit b [Candidatus Peregrinibacteria bacterium GW2011_GWA2_47_7]
MEGLSKLGIDLWSILIYVLNIGLLLLVLTYVLYKPIFKFLDERRAQIKSSVEEAQNLKVELDKKSAEVEAATEKAETELKKEMENLRKFTEEQRAKLTTEMEKARGDMLAKAEEDINRRKGEILKEAEVETLELIKKIVLYVVQNKVPAEVVEDSIKSAWSTARKAEFKKD